MNLREVVAIFNPAAQRTLRGLAWLVALFIHCADLIAFDSTETSGDVRLPALIRYVRTYGGSNETLPPVILVNQRAATMIPTFGERYATIEIDIQAPVPPDYFLRFVHCTVDWKEDNNVFLFDAAFLRSSNINWQAAPPSSTFYTYRGTMRFPNESIRISYGGNWKVQVVELGHDDVVIAEARFFAVDCAVDCTLGVYSDFYQPTKGVSPAALTLEATVTANLLISDLQLHTAAFYRLNRWYEMMLASRSSILGLRSGSRQRSPSSVSGFSGSAKRFRIDQIPAETEYRILDLSNLAQFPRSSTPIRLPLMDLRRNGTFFYRADNAAMISSGIPWYNDEYVPVEFVLDPENRPSQEDVFLIGSFNNWKTSKEWQLSYVESERLYKLRHWVRRARHNYCYVTGRINADTHEVVNLSYEEFEGNNVSAGQTFIVFVYYREPAFGGYDSIVGVAASSLYGPVRR